MENIEQQVLNTFQKNLSYLKKNHPKLHENIMLLNIALASEQYQEQYVLEYKDEGFFDIKELSTGAFLYQGNSCIHAINMANLIDLKRQGAIFRALKYVSATDEQAKIIEKSDLSFHNSLWATIKIIKYVEKYTSINSYMKEVPKVIFLGLGLGLHLSHIIKKLNSQVVFLKEQNLEIFRLSLFVTDYENLSNNRFLYFSIANSEISEQEIFLQFLNNGNNYNLNIKHVPFFSEYSLELKKLQEHVLSQSYINYGYSAMLLRYIDSPRYLAQNFSFLNVSRIYESNILSEKPILLLFSGPSTQRNLEWIKENHKKFIIISALSTCRLLNSINISPDIVIHIDPGEKTSKLFEGLNVENYFKKTQIILASNVNEDTVHQFNKEQIHFVEQGTTYKKGFARLSAPSVGEYAYGLSIILGAKNIFILGIDLSLDNETLQSHGDFHFANTKGHFDNHSASLDPNSSIEYIKGNLREIVPTVSGYKISIEQFRIFTDTLKNYSHTIYNLSDGAYLEGAEPLHIESHTWTILKEIDKSILFHELDNFFSSIGSTIFNEDDKDQIRHQVTEAKKLEKIIKQFCKKKFAYPETYLNALGQLSWDLSDMDYKRNSDLAQVYYEYFPIVLSYIFDLFNTQDLENPHKHMININTILMEKLLKISKLYISKLEEYLK